MDSILMKIGEQKRQEVEKAKRSKPWSSFDLSQSLAIRDFISGLKKRKPAIIAEIKKASPSKGLIREDFDVAQIASLYEQNGASCLSVLTDKHFFQGDPTYLALAKSTTTLPVLRKDFIIDSYQIYESRALGADCILLIVALLDDQQLFDYCQLAQELKMAVLVESHTPEEFQRALKLPTPLMGVNNRSLHSFVTDIAISLGLVEQLPPDRILISESGINRREDIELMQNHGINCFLIGESLMRSENIGATLLEFMGGKNATKKIIS